MIKSLFLFFFVIQFSVFSFSQKYSVDNKTFNYKNSIVYKIITENNSVECKLNIYRKQKDSLVLQNTIDFNKDIKDADLLSFGKFIDGKRKFILINTPYEFYILNLYNNKLLGSFKPHFIGIGQDAQSGMLSDVKIIMDGRFIIGFCVDSGTFLFDLTNLYKSHEVSSANIPYSNNNHVYILNHSRNNKKSFGLYISEENWKVNSKIIFTNMELIKCNDYSNIKQASETEIENIISNYSELDRKYTILKKLLPNNDFKYIVFDNYKVEFINLPAEIEKSTNFKVKQYLEKL